MGVKGLLGFMKKHINHIAMTVDLFHEARTRDGGIELLADFYAFENALLKSMWRVLDKKCGNYYIRLGLGEYATIDKYLKRVIKYLRFHDIEMVFYVDGARGSSSHQCERKRDTWKEKHKRHLSDLDYLLGVCDGRKKGLWFEPSVLPVLLETQFFETLNECSCEINQLPSGEVDYTVAKQLLERPKAFAILGNDTDFCIFKESAFIHVDWFEMLKDIGLENEAPASDCLKTTMVKQETLSNFLGLEHPELIEFAILCGNDFTFPQLNRLEMKEQMGFLDEWDLSEVADWIKQNRKVDRHPLVAEQPDLMRGIDYSRIFYSLGPLSAEPVGTQTEPMTSHIEEGIRNRKFPATVMSMHNSFYWHRHLLENTRQGQPSVEEELTELRRYVYGLLLPGPDNFVMEYGRTPEEVLKERKVIPVSKDLPKIHQISPDSNEQNMKIFYEIMTHQEHGHVEETAFSLMTNDNNKTNFLAYVLRYFLVMNTGKNLKLTQDEFESLVATAFAGSEVDIPFYQKRAIRPTVRCVTVGNWFQAVYRYAFDFIGKILKVSGEFPLPKEVFSGSVWTVFYMLGQASGGTVRTTRPTRERQEVPLSQPLRNRAEEERSRVLERTANLIRIVTHGFKLENQNSDGGGASGHQ